MKKNRMPERVESLREVNRSKNRPRTRLGFLKPKQNRLTEEQNLIKNRPSSAETGLAGRDNGI